MAQITIKHAAHSRGEEAKDWRRTMKLRGGTAGFEIDTGRWRERCDKRGESVRRTGQW